MVRNSDWLAASREIPKGRKVKEIGGEIWDDPQPMGFYSGPGPYAARRVFVKAKNGWWDSGDHGTIGNI